MATRYWAKGAEIYVSETPEEHRAARACGWTNFSPYDGVRFADLLAKQGRPNRDLPVGFTLDHLRQATEFGRAGRYGVLAIGRGGLLIRHPKRFRKVRPGEWALVADY